MIQILMKFHLPNQSQIVEADHLVCLIRHLVDISEEEKQIIIVIVVIVIIVVVVIVIIIIIVTRPRPAFGRLGLGGLSRGYNSHG